MGSLFEKFLNAFDNAILAENPERKAEFLQRAKDLILEVNRESESIFIGKPTLRAIDAKIAELRK